MSEDQAARERERDEELAEAIPVRAGGVLLPPGRLQIEPQARFVASSVNRVEVSGYTILPALTLGVIDVTRRSSVNLTTQIGLRYGLLDRVEVDFGFPFIVGKSDFSLSPKNSDANRAANLTAEGYGFGDLRMGARYQFNSISRNMPAFVGGVSVRFPTGRSPYESARFDADNQFLEKQIATGSGFYGITPTVSFVYPSAPGVLFGSLRYAWNIERSIDEVQPGASEGGKYGKIDPGDVLGGSLGLGLSLNDKLSISLNYDHSYVTQTRQRGRAVSGSTPIHIGTLGIGATWRLNPSTSYGLMLGIGVTDDAPDMSLGIRVPVTVDALSNMKHLFRKTSSKRCDAACRERRRAAKARVAVRPEPQEGAPDPADRPGAAQPDPAGAVKPGAVTEPVVPSVDEAGQSKPVAPPPVSRSKAPVEPVVAPGAEPRSAPKPKEKPQLASPRVIEAEEAGPAASAREVEAESPPAVPAERERVADESPAPAKRAPQRRANAGESLSEAERGGSPRAAVVAHPARGASSGG